MKSDETRLSPSPLATLLEEINAIARLYQEAIKQFHRAALRASKRQHPVEAAILHHIFARLSEPKNSPDESQQARDEVNELTLWLPEPAQYRKLSFIERKASRVHSVRRLKLDQANENWLLASATQKPGRPPDTRGVAVRALELRLKGQDWADIERRLLPHRRKAVNLGRSINREVQLLRSTLARYRVQVPR